MTVDNGQRKEIIKLINMKNTKKRGKQVGKETTLNRLRDLEIDSFDRESNLSNISSQMSSRQGLRTTKNFTRTNNQNMFAVDTVSEIHDEKEKNSIFNHSMKHGLFNDIRASPLKDRLPSNLRIYDPALEKRLFAKEASRIPGQGPSSRRTPAAGTHINPIVDDEIENIN